VTGPARPRTPRPSEDSIVERARAHLVARGYRVWVDPDGHDYFDLVARRGDEVGLVEAKVADGRAVLTQALRRRAWGDWSAVVVASERTARRIAERSANGRASPVGVWWVRGEAVEEVRPARPWVVPGTEDPFSELRLRFRRVLDALDAGELPAGVPWDGVLREIRHASGGRSFSEWRLDEPPA
jgi:hypothetical protein